MAVKHNVNLLREQANRASAESKVCLAASLGIGATSLVGTVLQNVSPTLADLRGLAWVSAFYFVLAVSEELKARAHAARK